MQTISLAAQAQALHHQTARHAWPALQPTPPCIPEAAPLRPRWTVLRPRLRAPAVEAAHQRARACRRPQWKSSCARRSMSSCRLGPAGVYRNTPSLAVAMRPESPRNAQLCRSFRPARARRGLRGAGRPRDAAAGRGDACWQAVPAQARVKKRVPGCTHQSTPRAVLDTAAACALHRRR
jgi:hypothetical protein